MISKKRWLTSVVAAAMAMGTLASCGTYSDGTTLSDSSETASTSASETSGESSEAASSGGDTFTIVATQPNTLNMIQSQSNLDNYCFYLTQEMLFRPTTASMRPRSSIPGRSMRPIRSIPTT